MRSSHEPTGSPSALRPLEPLLAIPVPFIISSIEKKKKKLVFHSVKTSKFVSSEEARAAPLTRSASAAQPRARPLAAPPAPTPSLAPSAVPTTTVAPLYLSPQLQEAVDNGDSSLASHALQSAGMAEALSIRTGHTDDPTNLRDWAAGCALYGPRCIEMFLYWEFPFETF